MLTGANIVSRQFGANTLAQPALLRPPKNSQENSYKK
jgi:hypothetical protein